MTSRPYTPSEEETPILSWGRLGAFVKLVEELDLYGLHFQHVALCERRVWFHLKRIDCAHLDERRRWAPCCTRCPVPAIGRSRASPA
jgi:hypothetical protein